MVVDYYSYSDKGERKVNEDSVGVMNENGIYAFALCDGLGGHGSGDIASKTAVNAMLDAAKLTSDDKLKSCLTSANEAVKSKQQELGNDMKTTATFLYIENNKASWAHIGDSRIYYYKKSKYVNRSLDHSVPQMLVAMGEIKEKDIRHHEDRSRLLRCIPWDTKEYTVDNEGFSLSSGDAFVMMSDGFWDWVDEKDIHKGLKKGKTAQGTAEYLKELAFKKGTGNNMDNLSVIVIKID